MSAFIKLSKSIRGNESTSGNKETRSPLEIRRLRYATCWACLTSWLPTHQIWTKSNQAITWRRKILQPLFVLSVQRSRIMVQTFAASKNTSFTELIFWKYNF